MPTLSNTSLPLTGLLTTATPIGTDCTTGNIPMKKDDWEKIMTAKAILEREYDTHYTLDELAYKVGTNECKLKMNFRKVTGKGVYEYLTEVRIAKTKEFLEITDMPLKAITRKVGLDRSNLTKNFKKATGISPREWRKINGNKYTAAISSLPAATRAWS